MRWSPLFACLLLPACALQAAQPQPATAIVAPAPRPPLECSAFSLLVNRDSASAAAVDPVETQMAVMRSRAFLAGAPAWLAPSGTMSLERAGSSALISVRVEAQPTRSNVVCDWLQRRTLEMARSERAQGLDWLREQELKLVHDAEAAREALAEFDKKNDLLVLGLDAQIEAASSELKALRAQRKPNEAALRSATDRALQLNLLQIERRNLARNADNAEKLSEAVRERVASTELESQLDRSVTLLDRCAPCSAP